MAFTTNCPNCGEPHQYAEGQVGWTGTCAKCRTTLDLIPVSRLGAPGDELEI